MEIKVPEAETLRTSIQIEKLSLWNRTLSGFIMIFEIHCFLYLLYSFFNLKNQKNIKIIKNT